VHYSACKLVVCHAADLSCAQTLGDDMVTPERKLVVAPAPQAHAGVGPRTWG
jgi:hypothetical protein